MNKISRIIKSYLVIQQHILSHKNPKWPFPRSLNRKKSLTKLFPKNQFAPSNIIKYSIRGKGAHIFNFPFPTPEKSMISPILMNLPAIEYFRAATMLLFDQINLKNAAIFCRNQHIFSPRIYSKFQFSSQQTAGFHFIFVSSSDYCDCPPTYI